MSYTQEEKEQAVNYVCDQMTKGLSRREILREKTYYDVNGVKKALPVPSTFRLWLLENEDMSTQYTRAIEDRAEFLFDELLDIADDQEGDVYIKDGVEQTNHNVIGRSRLRVDARKWALSKMLPRKYGDRIHQENSGDLDLKVIWKEERYDGDKEDKKE